MNNQTKLKCSHCDAEYSIKWDDDDIEPTTCPICGASFNTMEQRRIYCSGACKTRSSRANSAS